MRNTPILKNLFITAALFSFGVVTAQIPGIVQAEVDFTDTIRPWDGFGVNYVETAQTYDYEQYPQDYGGFSKLTNKDKQEIISLVFGDDGLRPSIVKMFLDPLHQTEENGAYDHAKTTENMRYFVKEGNKLTKKRNEELSVITTLYSAPAYTTIQNQLRGRDINEDKLSCMSDYMAHWAHYLLEEEDIPVKYISINNEGEDWRRWEADGGSHGLMNEHGHDYNVYMNPDMVVKVINNLRESLDKMGLDEVGVTNGEATNWYRFWAWNYAKTISRDKEALNNLGLITAHGFYVGGTNSPRWFGPHSNEGTELLRKYRPELRAWVTSTAWNIKGGYDNDGNRIYISDPGFLKEVHGNIYEAHCNAIIPWAIIQNASNWNKPDPNPVCAFRVYDDGTWEIKKGYYYFKQLTRAGRPGMAVTHAAANDSEIAIIAFSANNTENPNAFVAINWGTETFEMKIKVIGNESNSYSAYRTSGREIYEHYETARDKMPKGENYIQLDNFKVEDGYIYYEVPPLSATTFVEY